MGSMSDDESWSYHYYDDNGNMCGRSTGMSGVFIVLGFLALLCLLVYLFRCGG